MLDYHELEEKVFNFLYQKHQKDNNFTFSVRKVASKGSEADIFIGTEKSKYISFTLWDIPVYFPGSSGELLNFIIRLSKNRLKCYWEFTSSKNVHDDQNKLNLELGDIILEEVRKSDISLKSEIDSDKTKTFIIGSNREFDNIEEILKELDGIMGKIIPIIDDSIDKLKKKKPDWIAERIKPSDFKKSIDKMKIRLAKNAKIFNFDKGKNKKYWLYAPGQNAIKWEEFYQKGIMAIDFTEIGDLNQYNSKQEIADKFAEIYPKSKKNNDIACNHEFKSVISVGDVVIAKKGNSEYLGYGIVTSDYYWDDTIDTYGSFRKVNWMKRGSWKDTNIVQKTLTNITKHTAYVNKLINLIGIGVEDNKKEEMNHPLNTILYGPPGTGKTYNTILRAAEIIEKRKIESYDEALNIFKANLHDQIEFITFHQNYSYEDFIQGLRPETDNKSSLTFDKKDGVFKKIADKAFENLILSEKAPEELTNEALFDKALEKFKEIVEEKEENYPINETAYIMEVEDDAFRYTGEKWTNHSNGLRMKYSDLKEFYKNDVVNRKDVKHLRNISGLARQHATYYFFVYEKIIKRLPKMIDTPLKVEKKNFVIIIDEINRANISRVFGELITLIEPDKRSHGKIPMEAKLPSGDSFIVPSNLYIIGTMNTADKSIALLDIALRRRFDFEAMYPKYKIEGQEIYDVDILEKINEQIIKSKGYDFQIGHSYFMGENKDLIQRMNKKVIPLLLEYYMNDDKEVKGILESAGLIFEEKSWPLMITGKK